MFETEFAAIKSYVEELNNKYPYQDYTFGKPLSLTQIQDFERRHNIRLPHEYRAFISTVGAILYDENDHQFDFLLPLIYKHQEDYGLVSCPSFWHEENEFGTKEMRRWDELSVHEKEESYPALLINEDPSNTHYFLRLDTENYGEVWRCSEYEPQAKPVIFKSKVPLHFFQWMTYLLKGD